MAEYDRTQKKQESRAIANNETGNRQLKGFVDNRYSIIQCLLYYRFMNKAEATIAKLAPAKLKWVGTSTDCIKSKGDASHDHLKVFNTGYDCAFVAVEVDGDEASTVDNVIKKRLEPGNYGLGRNRIVEFNNQMTKEDVYHKVKPGSSGRGLSVGSVRYVIGVAK